MAAGLPVIASDFPSWRALLGEINCVLFVDPANPDSIKDAMEWVLQNPDEAQEMGERGRSAVQNPFNWTSEASDLKSAYLELGIPVESK